MKLSLEELKNRGVELSAEEEAEIKAEEQRQREKDERLTELEKSNRVGGANAKLSEYDKMGLEKQPGLRNFVAGVLMSDDGGTALEFSEHNEKGETVGNPKPMTATEIIEGFFEHMPKKDDKLALADQVGEQPGDEKPPEEREDDKDKYSEEGAPARAAELEQETGVPWARPPEPVNSGGDR